jgi:ubiquinol-cytochrome c reductase cytochrome b subunit
MVALALIFAVGLLLSKNVKGVWKIIWPVVLVGVAVALRVFDAKFWGVVVMGGTVVILGFLPWLDQSKVKSIRYRPTWHKLLYVIFMIDFVVLGYIGTQPPTPVLNIISQVGTLIYLAFFFFMPIWSRLGTFKQVPDRVTFHPHA